MDDSYSKLIVRVIANLLAGILITAALHFAFSFTWPQALVLAWLYCMLKSEVESINKRIHL